MNSEAKCIFCNISEMDILTQNDYAFVIEDLNPVSKYHSLIIPKRHFSDFFLISVQELSAVYSLLNFRKNEIIEIDPTVSGYNIGVNSGASSGQTIFHCHIHLIPRRNGDIKNPKGGIRGAIPHKMHY